MAERYVNLADTVLTGAVDNTATLLPVLSVSTFPVLAPGDQLRVTVADARTGGNPEIMIATAITGNTITVTRAVEGTTALAHPVGSTVTATLTVASLIALIESMAAMAAAHPDLDSHDTLGLATDAALTAHAATSHGTAHPDLGDHDTLGLATDAELTAHAADSTNVHGIADTADLVDTDDPRLTDPRPPTGPAGGVLSGTYPDPGFAADLATQAELNAHAATSHGTAHPDLAAHDTLGLVTQTELDVAIADLSLRVIRVVIDGGGAPIVTGPTGVYVSVPFDATITRARLLSDVTGSAVVDVWKDSYANFPPTVADSICGSAKPALTAANKSELTTLTGWTTAITAGDILEVNVDSAATVGRLLLDLFVTVT